MRACLVVVLLAIVIAIFWFDRDGLKDQIDGDISFSDILYFGMITVTTVGYGDIVPVSDNARLIDAFAVTPIRIFIWFIFLGTAYEFVIQKIVEDFRMARLHQSLEGHIVLCGFGHSGMIAARETVAKGHPADRIVAIDLAEDRVRAAADAGFIGLLGDATSEELLTKACVDKAKAVIVNTRRDDTNILVILTVRHLSKQSKVIASIRDEENIKLARLSGADLVVTPTQGRRLPAGGRRGNPARDALPVRSHVHRRAYGDGRADRPPRRCRQDHGRGRGRRGRPRPQRRPRDPFHRKGASTGFSPATSC